MSADRITPIVLTSHEESNIGRTLDSLRWAKRVVVCDSGSRDRTEAIARTFPNVAWFERAWEGFAAQWTYAFSGTGIDTDWVLALDADMSTPEDLVAELGRLADDPSVNGAIVRFQYRVGGTPLWGSFYPPQLRFLRRENATVVDRGHTHDFHVPGRTVPTRCALVHDDRKALERFVAAQLGYCAQEHAWLDRPESPFSVRDALRRHMPFLPELVGLAAYLRAGGPFRGAAARRYGIERLLFEAMLRYRLLEARQKSHAEAR